MRTTKTSSDVENPAKKVMIIIQDHDAVGRVYTIINGQVQRKDVLLDALRQVDEGTLYADKECRQQIRGPYIEIYKNTRANKRYDEFVFLIDMEYVRDHIVSMKIL